MSMKELIGCTIQKIFLDDNKSVLQFKTDNGVKTWEAYGDCCSNTWIEHVNNVNEAIGHKVKNVMVREMPEPPQEQYECLQSYGYSIEHTGSPPLDIEFRNSSNGYYGGSLEFQEGETEIFGNELKEDM